MKIKCLFVVFALFLFHTAVSAEVKVANDPSRICVGSRVLGMGKSFVGQADDIGSIFMNPAGLSSVNNTQYTSMSGKFVNEVNYFNLGGTIPSRWGTFGIAYVDSNIGFSGPSAVVDQNTQRVTPSTTESGSFGSNNSVFLLSFGAPTKMPDLSIGGTLKLFSQTLAGPQVSAGSALGYNMDMGIKYSPRREIGMGAIYQNFIPYEAGGRLHWSSGANESLPSVLKMGMNLKLLGENGFKQFRDHTLTLNIDNDFNIGRLGLPNLYHLGLEWAPVEVLNLRLGFDQDALGSGDGAAGVANNLTAGVGFFFRAFRFDYAYHQYFGLTDNDTHYFSLSYGFAQKGSRT